MEQTKQIKRPELPKAIRGSLTISAEANINPKWKTSGSQKLKLLNFMKKEINRQ
jgi:hypothetical protein